MEYIKHDELQSFYGKSYVINEHLTVKHPKIKKIMKYGEEKYFSLIHSLTAIPSDMKSMLFDNEIDYEEISDFEFFTLLYNNFTVEDTEIIFGDQLDFSKLERFRDNKLEELFLAEPIDFVEKILTLNDEALISFIDEVFLNMSLDIKKDVLDVISKYKNKEIDDNLFKSFFPKELFDIRYPKEDGIYIDEHIYMLITNYLKGIHGIQKKADRSGNQSTKDFMIELDRQEKLTNKNKKFKSVLLPLIIALVNCGDFKYNYKTVLKLPIKMFMDSMTQIQKYKNFNFTMSGIYAGTVDIKKINKKELNWI